MVRRTKVTVMLAQFAQALPNGIVNIMGGGLTLLPPSFPVVFIAGMVELPWDAAGVHHNMRFELLDDQGLAVQGDNGPIMFDGQFDVAPNAGLKRGTPLCMPLAIPIGPLSLTPDARFEWRFEIDDEAHEDWRLGFTTLPEAQSQVA
jgi:hypothetical protein